MRLVQIVALMIIGFVLAWVLGGQVASNVGVSELHLIGELRVVLLLSTTFGFVCGILIGDLRNR